MLSNVMSSGLQKNTAQPAWTVVITEWALDSYLDLKHLRVFTPAEYKNTLRPDVELLKAGIPSPHPKFQQSTFWGPAKQGTVVLQSGYKMKWRQIGQGKVLLRLPVMAHQYQSTPAAFLCHCYVKSNAAKDQRMMARFKSHMNLIAQGQYHYRGTI